ncbi:hypothetical protein U9M48_033788 [Paspalum notatum var. saurae]|uniref:Retrotransposon gag domain-containing protein n=1 Tax=Paspalum notatum var. saurae TaxID=547442 RepID=A0AAQ3X6J6_PASNO
MSLRRPDRLRTMVDGVESDNAPPPKRERRRRGTGGGETDGRYVPQPENPVPAPEIKLPPPPEPQPPNPQAPSLDQLIANQNLMIANQNQFMQAMANLLQAQKNQNAPPNPVQNDHSQDPQPESFTHKVEGFIKLRAPTFDYTYDPIKAEDWLREIEKKLDLSTCTDEECVALAVHQLIGSASAWWESFCETHNDPDSITWEEFTAAFREFFVPKEMMVHKAGEFRNLKQGTMKVQEYVNLFVKMMRYAPDDTKTNEKKQYWFLQGLHPEIQVFLTAGVYRSLRHMMSKAISIEKEVMDYDEGESSKRKRTDHLSQPGPSQRFKFDLGDSDDDLDYNANVQGSIRHEAELPTPRRGLMGRATHTSPNSR